MEYSTESLLFFSDYANSQTILKNVVLSAEARGFCHQSDQFVNEAKLDPEKDDIEAQIGVINNMILASNIPILQGGSFDRRDGFIYRGT